MTGAEHLRDWMRRRGFTQAEAGRYLELDESLMSRLVNGRYKPGLAKALELERLTGIPVEAWAPRRTESRP
jgi:transcriptional regulator with XRE-family HTH domain